MAPDHRRGYPKMQKQLGSVDLAHYLRLIAYSLWSMADSSDHKP